MGWQELLLLAILIVLVVRPKDMPALMKSAGTMIGKAKRMMSDITDEIERTDHNLKIQAQEIVEDEQDKPSSTK